MAAADKGAVQPQRPLGQEVVTIRQLTRLPLLLGLGLALCGIVPAAGQLQTYSIPGDIGWQQGQQLPFNANNFFQLIDFRSFADAGGIAPKDTVAVVAVPDLRGAASTAELTEEQQTAFTSFAQHVSRDSLFARNDAEVGALSVSSGDLLLPAKQNVPTSLRGVQLLKEAGIDSIRAMVDLAHAVLWPRDPQRRFETLLNSPTIYEEQLTEVQLRTGLESLVDNDPATAFVRVEQENRQVEIRAVVIRMDIVGRFPVGLVRFYPRPRDPPLRLTAYQLEINDGVDMRPTQQTNTRRVTSFEYELLGDQVLPSQPGLPNYSLLRIEQGNSTDTVRIAMNPPRNIRFFQFRSLTGLDWDVAAFQVYNQGYPPLATWVSRPLPVDKSAIDELLEYQAGDLSLRSTLDQLPGATLGRIRWDVRSIGDPTRSKVEVSFQTGVTPEPLILFRLNANGDAVEWRANATVVDRRPGSPSRGDSIDLDNPNIRSRARDIWNALSDAERASAQTTLPEYIALSPANRADKNSFALPRIPDPVNWSGFQPVTNGQLITVPGERPFFQVRVRFTSERWNAAKIIENIRFESVLPPLLPGVTAEIVPAVDITAGDDTLFTYAMRPRLTAGDEGFNHIRIRTPAPATIERVRFAYGDRTEIVRTEDVAITEKARTDSFVVVEVPPVGPATARNDSLIILMDLRSRVLSSKTTFTGFVFNDTFDPGLRRDYSGVVLITDPAQTPPDTLAQLVPQRVNPGDVVAFGEGDRNTLDVVTSVTSDIEGVITRLRMEPPVISPNADGVNDELSIRFDLLRVIENVPVQIEVFDLSGRRVRSWMLQRKVSAITETWDGTDEAGNLVVPGTYLVQVTARTDGPNWGDTRVVSVVY